MSWGKYRKIYNFFLPIEKTKDKDGNESVVTISYKNFFFDIARFMATSLSNPVDHLT